jgi:hypothetical protein
MNILKITTEYQLNNKQKNSDGYYEIKKHGESFIFEGKLYTYYSSGLARSVYKSEFGKYVIKDPQ